jgi:hypothetical protein
MPRKIILVSDIGVSQYNTLIAPDTSLSTLTGAEILENKTLESPEINDPVGITKSDVGLSAVDNTADIDKPISAAVQTALDAKYTLGAPLTATAADTIFVGHFVGTTSAPTVSAGAGITSASLSGTDIGGGITFTTDATPVTGIDVSVAHIQFGRVYTAVPYVVISPANEAASIAGFVPHVTSSLDGFDILSNQVLAFPAATTFVYNYVVVQ